MENFIIWASMAVTAIATAFIAGFARKSHALAKEIDTSHED
jgi:hypothetical protein